MFQEGRFRCAKQTGALVDAVKKMEPFSTARSLFSGPRGKRSEVGAAHEPSSGCGIVFEATGESASCVSSKAGSRFVLEACQTCKVRTEGF